MIELNPLQRILAIDEVSFESYVAAEVKMADKMVEMQSLSTKDDDENQSRLLEMHEDIAVINISGMLTNHNSYWNRYFGMVAYDEIREAFIQAHEGGAKAAFVNYDSPGGSVSGLSDAANLIDSLDMFTVAFTSSMMASAAYFLASQSDKIYCDDMADVGSIGVIAKLYDRSEYLKDKKIKPVRFRSGKFKGTGDGDFKLSKEELALIQDRVDKTADKFFQIVSDARGIPLTVMEDLEITTGKTFMGAEAFSARLVDGIKSFDESAQEVHNYVKKIDKFT